VIISATLYFFLCLLTYFRQGPHLRVIDAFFSSDVRALFKKVTTLRFSPLLLVVDLDDPICGPHPLFREAFYYL